MDNIKNFTPREIISELDQFIIGQEEAKRAVAIAMRNRWRRRQVSPELRDEITPKNIIMIGPTGVGKTEIARRLSKLANAPFVKVEASKFTEVGYVGKDVESMIRELTDSAVSIVRSEEEERVRVKAEILAEERLLDLLVPEKPQPPERADSARSITSELLNVDLAADLDEPRGNPSSAKPRPLAKDSTREKMREMLRKGKLDNRTVELESAPHRPLGGLPMIEVVSTGGSLDDMSRNLREMFSSMMPRDRKRRKVKVPEALQSLTEEEVAKLVDMDEVIKLAIERVEQNGIIFIDEIDKIASREKGGGHGPEVSREGVQRDILPIVEGSRVSTRYGMVSTDHILFIAAGAFHVSKPSDLIPELQGRFPIRVELNSLTEDDFFRILTETTNSLTKQYTEMLKTEGVTLNFVSKGLKEIARYATILNDQMENIGARRLHTIMEKVLDEISFNAPETPGQEFKIDAAYVNQRLESIAKDQDLSRYIL